MSNQLLSIRQSKAVTGKQALKNWVGSILATVHPARVAELEMAPLADPQSLTDKVLMSHLRNRAVLEGRQDFLDRLHRQFWAGDQGAEFSGNCDHRFQDLFLAKQQEDFEVLRNVWQAQRVNQIVEIGTSSGLLLQYLTQELSGVVKSTGIDVNAEQIKRNQASTRFDSRIDFLCTDGQRWVLENAQPRTLFVSNGGVLEYFQRVKLDEMVNKISEVGPPAVFFASEPVAHDHDFNTCSSSVPFGEELSFSHNYRDLFESNGWKVLHQRAVNFETWKMQVTIAAVGETPAPPTPKELF